MRWSHELPDKRKYPTFSGEVFYLVGYVSKFWNTIEPSLLETAQRLAALGMEYYDGEVHYQPLEENNHV